MRKLWVIMSIVLLALSAGAIVAQEGGNRVQSEFAGRVAAPEFPAGLDWINVDAPLTMEALRGKVVLFDFWTYGCINCIHMIPTLEKLEAKYAGELVVIGVHSAKFANESQTENIRQIVRRYDLHHPVINDKDFIVWRTYGINAWPSFVLIDPAGKVLARDSGEIPFEAFDRVISGMVDYFDSLGQINREPVKLALEGAGQPNSLLAFPGKVLADPAGNRLFIADSNHHRLVIADLTTYEVLDVIGASERGYKNGSYTEAMFDRPQGMALDGSTLYVADTNNHAIRAVDLDAKTVTTVAGTGFQGTRFVPFGTAIVEPTGFDLRSPWDVEMGEGDTLYIAMAGMHQIWALSLDSQRLFSVVGSGREALKNGTLDQSELAQPSGLYFKDGLLYFADSESSSIRVADFTKNEVRTVAGPAENTLFDFGDKDGKVGESRLQHALGVVGGDNGLIYVADTYNSKIKVIDPATTEATTLLGLPGDGGFRDGGPDEAQFDEPGGLDYASGKLYVADTNNNAIRVIDLAAKTVSTITFPNPEKLQIAGRTTVIGSNSAAGLTVRLPEQAVSAGEGEIVLKIVLPDGYKINPLIESMALLSAANSAVEIGAEAASMLVSSKEVRIPVKLTQGSDTVYTDLTLYYCRESEESLCFIDSVVLEAPVSVGPAGGFETTIMLEREVTPPDVPDAGIG